MNKATHTRLLDWACGLSEDEATEVIVTLVEYGIDTEDIKFHEDSEAPYWDSCGDPLVEQEEGWEE